MVDVSNSDMDRILLAVDIAIDHYKSLKDLRNCNNARMLLLIKEKINRKLIKQHSKSQNHDKE